MCILLRSDISTNIKVKKIQVNFSVRARMYEKCLPAWKAAFTVISVLMIKTFESETFT